VRWIIPALAALAVCSTSAFAAGDAAAGKKKAIKCSVCHGMNGIAKNPLSSNLAGQSAIYLDRSMKAYKTGERKNEQMSVIAPALTDEDIADLAAYYSSIKITVEVPK
jgi:cytochrome c553